MKYVGSKERLAKDLIPILNSYRKDRRYVEPFVGGANLIQYMDGKRIGYDICPYLIALLKAVRNGWKPPFNVSEEMYNNVKNNPSRYSYYLYGFVAYCCSYSGKFWGGYARGKKQLKLRPGVREQKSRNYAQEQAQHLIAQAVKLQGCKFYVRDYKDLHPKNCLVYCDPPYHDTTEYSKKFDSVAFWKWAREISKTNTVLVSSYISPMGWKCIFEKELKTYLRDKKDSSRTDKLFIWSR